MSRLGNLGKQFVDATMNISSMSNQYVCVTPRRKKAFHDMTPFLCLSSAVSQPVRPLYVEWA